MWSLLATTDIVGKDIVVKSTGETLFGLLVFNSAKHDELLLVEHHSESATVGRTISTSFQLLPPAENARCFFLGRGCRVVVDVPDIDQETNKDEKKYCFCFWCYAQEILFLCLCECVCMCVCLKVVEVQSVGGKVKKEKRH